MLYFLADHHGKAVGNFTRVKDDKTNWEDIYRSMNASGMARTDEDNLDIFETILRVNARERGAVSISVHWQNPGQNYV